MARVKLTQDELLDEISLDLFGEPRRKGEFTVEEFIEKHGGSRDIVYCRLERLVLSGRYEKRKALVNNRQRCLYRKLPNVGTSQQVPTKVNDRAARFVVRQIRNASKRITEPAKWVQSRSVHKLRCNEGGASTKT